MIERGQPLPTEEQREAALALPQFSGSLFERLATDPPSDSTFYDVMFQHGPLGGADGYPAIDRLRALEVFEEAIAEREPTDPVRIRAEEGRRILLLRPEELRDHARKLQVQRMRRIETHLGHAATPPPTRIWRWLAGTNKRRNIA